LGIGLSRKGYTLVELVVVVFLAGMMLFLAVPAMRNVFLSDQLQSTTRQLATIARELRIDAVREQVDFVLHFDMTRNSYWTYAADMTPEKKDERKKKALLIPEGVKITDIYHVGGTKKTDGEIETIFYKSGVVQPTVIHLNKEELAATIILEPFLNQVRIFDRYIEFPGDGDNS
jgi:prepilin-type N-terminal cleavage/methylation domain-containing protein